MHTRTRTNRQTTSRLPPRLSKFFFSPFLFLCLSLFLFLVISSYPFSLSFSLSLSLSSLCLSDSLLSPSLCKGRAWSKELTVCCCIWVDGPCSFLRSTGPVNYWTTSKGWTPKQGSGKRGVGRCSCGGTGKRGWAHRIGLRA